jgi:hypothetical protein
VDGEGPEEFHGRVHDIALDSLEDFMNLSGREARLSGTLVEILPHPFTGSYSRSRHIAPSF